MPSVSKRGERMTQSPIRSLIPYARMAKDKGIEVIHLNIGQPDIKTPQVALDRLKTYDDSIIEYGASEGNIDLRRVVHQYYCDHVAPIELSDIYVTTGASEAIMFTLFSCFDAHEEIVIPEPFYANYIGFAHTSGVNLVPVTSYLKDGFKLPSPEAFIQKITSSTKAIFLCNPGNPTGNLYSKAELLDIARLVKEHDLFLIVDEVYREFCYDEEFTSVLALEEIEDYVVVIDSISKVFSACGSRVGFIVSRNQYIMKSILKYAQLRLCPPMLGQYMAAGCFEERSSYISQVKDEYNARRKFLYNRLSEIDGVKIYMPKAAFYIMTELPVDDASHFAQWLLEHYHMDHKTIMLAPGNGFYLNQEHGKRQVRIAFVLGVEQLAIAMDILESALIKYTSIFTQRQQSYSYI